MRFNSRVAMLVAVALTLAALTVTGLASLLVPELSESAPTEVSLGRQIGSWPGQVQEFSLSLPHGKRASASISLDVGNRHAVIGTLRLPGNLESLYIDPQRNIAYLANSYSGLQIIDISTPEQPQILGSLATPVWAWDIEVRGNLLYLASAQEGMHIIDISDVTAPKIVSQTIFEQAPILKLAVFGNTVYATTGKKGLQVYDVSDPGKPALVDTLYRDKGAWGLMVDNGVLYLSCGRFRLESLDLSTPTTPRPIGSTPLPEMVWDMAIHDGILFLPARNEGLFLVDTRNPKSLVPLSHRLDLPRADNVVVSEDRAYISSRTGSIGVVDLSEPRNPYLVERYDLAGHPRDIGVSGQHAYLAGGLAGFQIIDLDRLQPTAVQSLKVPGELQSVELDDQYYYLLTRKKGLFIAERTAPGRAGSIIASLPFAELAEDMIQHEKRLFVAFGHTGLRTIDISDPHRPHVTSNGDIKGEFHDIALSGEILFLADQKRGIVVVDCSNPDAPREIKHVSLHGPIRITTDDTRLYAATRTSGLHIYNIQHDAGLVEVGRASLPWPLQEFTDINSLAVANGFLHLSGGPAGLLTFDVKDPSKPRLRKVLSLDDASQTVFTARDKIYTASRKGKLWILSENNDVPTPVAIADSLGKNQDIHLDNEWIVLANGIKGLTLLPHPNSMYISPGTGRTTSHRRVTAQIKIPDVEGVYNLSVFINGELKEFVGALTRTAD